MPSKQAAQLANPYKEGIEAVAINDTAVAQMYDLVGLPDVRQIDHHWHSLIKLIVEQQLSTSAAYSVWQRVMPLLPNDFGEFSPNDETLLSAGLSRPKVRYVHAIAEALKTRQIDLFELEQLDDASVMQRLMTIKGIGPWSAQCYLLFALKRHDVFPYGDLALLRAWQFEL